MPNALVSWYPNVAFRLKAKLDKMSWRFLGMGRDIGLPWGKQPLLEGISVKDMCGMNGGYLLVISCFASSEVCRCAGLI